MLIQRGTKSLMAAQMIDQLRATQVWLGVDGSPSRERGGGWEGVNESR